MWDKDKEASPKEGDYNRIDSKEQIEVVAMMEIELQ